MVLYSHDTTIRIHIQAETLSTIMTNEHTFLEEYTSHSLFTKGLWKGWCCYVWEVSWRRRETVTYWPQIPSFSSCWATRPGVTESHKPSACKLILTLASYLQLELQFEHNSNCPKPTVAPGYIIVWYPPASCGCMHLHRIQPHPQVKVIFQYLRPDACVSWLTVG